MKRIQRTWMLGMASALLVWNCQQEENAPADTLVSGGTRDVKQEAVPLTTGQAVITLPDIPAEKLAKAGTVSTEGDTLGWFHLVITWGTGDGIKKAFPIQAGLKGQTFLVTDIPVGDKRQFQGFITNKDGVLRYQGTTYASIVSGQTASVVLHMGPPSGSANICVTVDGVASSCDTSTIDPPPIKEPLPPKDTVIVLTDPVVFECYYIAGNWKAGELNLVPLMMSSRRSWFVLDNGDSLLVEEWKHEKDSIQATILAQKDFKGEKWVMRGAFAVSGYWQGTVHSTTTKASFSVSGKTLPCKDGVSLPPRDTIVHKDTVVVVDPSDPLPTSVLPLPTDPKQVTVCAEIRMDYATACESTAFLKMDVSAGKIQYGYLMTATTPSSEYAPLTGYYSTEKLYLMGVPGSTHAVPPDTLILDGYMGGLAEAKGEYTRLPGEKRGNWYLRFIQCGGVSLKPPPENCPAL